MKKLFLHAFSCLLALSALRVIVQQLCDVFHGSQLHGLALPEAALREA